MLAAYLAWGENLATHLAGAFSFVIWDEANRKLVCVRDQLGQIPFYFAETREEFSFASSLEILRRTIGHDGSFDETGLLAQMVRHGPLMSQRSVFAGIQKLPPGSVLTVDARGSRRAKYWRPTPKPGAGPSRPGDCAELLRITHEKAVTASIPADCRVGAHLSGGIDSASVAVVAAEHLRSVGSELTSLFSWSPPPDEAEVPQRDQLAVMHLARNLGAPVAWSELTPATLAEDLARDLAGFPNDSGIYETQILQRAAASGVSIVLSGWGGDECVSYGGGQHLGLLLRPSHIRQGLHHCTMSARRHGHESFRLARSVAGMVRTALRTEIHQRSRRAGKPLPDPVGISWERLHPSAPELRQEALRLLRTRTTPAETQSALLEHGHLASRMEAWYELAAPKGIAYAFPFLDVRLIEVALSFPENVWLAQGYNRWVFRKAMEGVLPQWLIWGELKSEPARIESYLEQATRPPLPDHEPEGETAKLILAYRRLLAEALDQQRSSEGFKSAQN